MKFTEKSITHLHNLNDSENRFALEIIIGSTWKFQKTVTHPVEGLDERVAFDTSQVDILKAKPL